MSVEQSHIERYYITMISQMKLGNYRGRIYSAKPIFLLSILSLIENRKVKNNRFYFLGLCADTTYKTISNQFTSKPTPIQYPFYHLKNEPFWHLKWRNGEAKVDTPSAKFIRDNIEYAYLDNALWDLLQMPYCLLRIRMSIYQHFFARPVNELDLSVAAEPEQNYGNMEGEATPRQLWALKLATGVDYRGQGLTKAEASEMIANAKQEAEEKGEKTFSNEATTRQLNYLKRTTGIDYSDKGLTKAEATKMIRELKEAEEDASIAHHEEEEATRRQLNYLKRATGVDYTDQGLTKLEASKMISEIIDNGEGEAGAQSSKKSVGNPDNYIKPGSLEDILSKCKTREEQLEAARRFFGEDK